MEKCLIVDPKERWTCEQLLGHEWLKEQAAADAAKEKAADALASAVEGVSLSTAKEVGATSEKLKKLKGTFLAAFAAAAMSGEVSGD